MAIADHPLNAPHAAMPQLREYLASGLFGLHGINLPRQDFATTLLVVPRHDQHRVAHHRTIAPHLRIVRIHHQKRPVLSIQRRLRNSDSDSYNSATTRGTVAAESSNPPISSRTRPTLRVDTPMK